MTSIKKGMREVMNTGAWTAFKDVRKKKGKHKRSMSYVAKEWGVM